jgi:hypothetical protein
MNKAGVEGPGPGSGGWGPMVFGDKEAGVGVRTFSRETPRGQGWGPLIYGMDPTPKRPPDKMDFFSCFSLEKKKKKG